MAIGASLAVWECWERHHYSGSCDEYKDRYASVAISEILPDGGLYSWRHWATMLLCIAMGSIVSEHRCECQPMLTVSTVTASRLRSYSFTLLWPHHICPLPTACLPIQLHCAATVCNCTATVLQLHPLLHQVLDGLPPPPNALSAWSRRR